MQAQRWGNLMDCLDHHRNSRSMRPCRILYPAFLLLSSVERFFSNLSLHFVGFPSFLTSLAPLCANLSDLTGYVPKDVTRSSTLSLRESNEAFFFGHSCSVHVSHFHAKMRVETAVPERVKEEESKREEENEEKKREREE